MPSDAEAQFAEFQRSGSPLALAQVFDLLAPQLLLLAGHLVRDAAAAEDLVQSTFLDAIAVAQRFDPTRGTVQRWLVGILVNNARKEQRRRGRVLDATRLAPEPAGNPEAEAAAAEFLHTVEQALTELPPQYREVLRLGLLHGLDQAEIATSLARPRETVKTQFRRGVDRLRQLLPRGFALSVALAFTMGRGMAGVRRAVLTRAEGLAASVGPELARSVGRRRGMPRPLVLAAAGIAVLAVVLPIVSLATRGAERGPAAPVAPSVAGTQSPPSELTAPAGRTQAAPRNAGVATTAAGGAVRLVVRFARDAQPAAGVVVRCRPLADRDWLREVEATCDADGRATVPLPVAGSWRVVADRGGETLVDVAPQQEVAATLEIPTGVAVRGTVADATGQPLAGSEVWLATAADLYVDCVRAACTDGAGQFTLRDVTPGRFVGVLDPGWAQEQVQEVRGDALGACELRFALRNRTAPITGLVRGPDGAAAAGAIVLAAGTLGHPAHAHAQLPRRVRCDDQGRFRLLGMPRDGVAYLSARSPSGVCGLAACDLATSALPLEVALVHGATIRGAVTDAAGATVTATWAADRTVMTGVLPDLLRTRVAVCGPDGRFVLEHVAPGGMELIAAHPQQGAARDVVHLLDQQEFTWQPRLASTGDVRCQVSDARGAPLAGWTVALARPLGQGTVLTGKSNAQGRCVFRGVEQAEYVLTAKDPDVWLPHVPARLTAVWPGEAVQRVVVADARRARSWITFRALRPGGQPFVPELHLLHLEGTEMVIGPAPVAQVGDRCRVGPLPAGRCQGLMGTADLGAIGFDRELLSGQDLELGDVAFQTPMAIEVLVPAQQGSGEEFEVGVLAEAHARYLNQAVVAVSGRAVVHAQPGQCVLRSWTPRLPPLLKRITAMPGGRATIVVETPAVVQRDFLYRLPQRGDRVPVVELVLRSLAGEVLYEAPLVMPGWNRAAGTQVALLPGSYEVELRDPLRGGPGQRTRFVVTAEPTGAPVFQVGPF